MSLDESYSAYSMNADGFPSHAGSRARRRNVSTSSSCARFSPIAPVSPPPTSFSLIPALMPLSPFSVSGCSSYDQSTYAYNAFTSAMTPHQMITSNDIYAPIPHNMDHVSCLLQVQTPIASHTPVTSSPLYHSENSFSTLSTPSDVSRMPMSWPRETRGRAFSAPSGSQPVFTDQQLYPRQDINARIAADYARQGFEQWAIEHGRVSRLVQGVVCGTNGWQYLDEQQAYQSRDMSNNEYWAQDFRN